MIVPPVPEPPDDLPVSRCRRCGGWTRVLDGDWLVPHLTAARKRIRACSGGGTRSGGPVIPFKELVARRARRRARCRPGGAS